MIKTVLSIAGFDGSGGAGLQADIKTASALGCYATNVLTAVAVQNTQKVYACYDLPIQALQQQFEAIFTDIKPDAIKIGMLFNADIITVVADFLRPYYGSIPIVVDPVMVATSGDSLLEKTAIEALIQQLLPIATLITPNIPEAKILTRNQGGSHNNEYLGQQLLTMTNGAVLLKGGHERSTHATDILLQHQHPPMYFTSPRVNTNHTHGTGCSLSSAIACYLAKGFTLEKACDLAKRYLSGAIVAGKHGLVGNGNGPVHHFYQHWK